VLFRSTIGAFNQSKSWILYESLDCSEFNNGVSGNGGSKTVTESAIKISLSKFKYLSGESEDDLNNLKTPARIRRHDDIYQMCCEKLGWNFTPLAS
jgi:hypothetical protein